MTVNGRPLLAISCGVLAVLILMGLTLHRPLPASGQLVSLGDVLDGVGSLSIGSLLSADEPGAAAGPTVASGSLSCGPVAADGFQQCQFTDESGLAMDFYLHVPASYDPQQKYPLVLVLHGGGERAKPDMTPAQCQAVLTGTPYLSAWVSDGTHSSALDMQSEWPSFIVAPQLQYPNRWVNVPSEQGSYQQAADPTPGLQLAREIVDQLQREYSGIDAGRLYVTGISLGGYGTWDAIERWPGYFAAAVPVSGGGDPSKAWELKDLPIWVFHGVEDRIVPVSGSRDMVEAIRAAGGQPKWTEYAGAGHDIWARVYAASASELTTNLFQWLFAQRKGSADDGRPAGQ